MVLRPPAMLLEGFLFLHGAGQEDDLPGLLVRGSQCQIGGPSVPGLQLAQVSPHPATLCPTQERLVIGQVKVDGVYLGRVWV